MAAKLRSAVGRAARRVVSEDLPIILRGPCPNPATAAEADLLAKKADAAAKKGWVNQFTRRLIQEQKKIPDRERAPWFALMSFVALFMSGYEVGRAQGKLMMYKLQKPEESN